MYPDNICLNHTVHIMSADDIKAWYPKESLEYCGLVMYIMCRLKLDNFVSQV